MSDVAAAAGVARATVYRYFPSRQALLDELAQLAVDDAHERLASARIDEVAAIEGLARSVRALVEVGDHLVVLARADQEQFERRLAAPLRRLFEHGQSNGDFRDDIPSSWLTESLIGLVASVLGSRPSRGREDTVAAITGLFLDGARAGRRRDTPETVAHESSPVLER
jgi:TetR/AcrR family transcriptional regulator, mexCD-oprJ operon repressor